MQGICLRIAKIQREAKWKKLLLGFRAKDPFCIQYDH